MLISIIGTVIPQREAYELYLKLYGEAFAGLFVFLGLTNFYYSFVFNLVLILLGCSIFVCSLKRLTSALRGQLSIYKWGSFFAHVSVLIIYLGAIYGAIAGFSDNINIEKGSSYFEPHKNFSVKLNDFNAKFDASGRPTSFTSDLSVIDGSKEVLRKTIFVNNPLAYKGVKFYQSSFGLKGVVEVKGPGGVVENIPIYKGSISTYKATNQMFQVEDIMPDLHLLHGTAIDTYEATTPAAFIPGIGWLVKNKPISVQGYTFKLIGATEFTGLQVKMDPGIPAVFIGFLFLTIGVGIMIYVKR
ncbi:cytochrome c biogenesis protein ResB [Candidatus Saganbacteria bacterium]|nr:cytochrome c biogenesis protein ResB [Candidatus Saganbacteria bacterium]